MKKWLSKLLCTGIVMSVVLSYGMCVFADENDEPEVTDDTEVTETADGSDVDEAEETDADTDTEAATTTDADTDTATVTDTDNVEGSWFTFEDDKTNEELAEGYVSRKMSLGKEVSNSSFDYAECLEGYDRPVFEYLMPIMAEIADGKRNETVITIPDSVFSTDLTAEDLEVESLDGLGDFELYVLSMSHNPVHVMQVVYALMHSSPYELYWFDKTQGLSVHLEAVIKNGYVHVCGLTLGFVVYEDFRNGNEFNISPYFGSGLKKAAANAKAIISECAGMDDYHKLMEYHKRICLLTDYNFEAFGHGSHKYGDPFQMVWVFDGDPETNVVCEGYAKAFKYLCDNTAFTSDEIYAISVSGICQESHMWNIVHMDDGKNYHVDITNSDPQGEGNYSLALFMRGASGNVSEGYTLSDIYYSYDEDMITLYGNDVLSLAEEDYDNSKPGGEHDIMISTLYNGKVSLSKTKAAEGEEIEITVTPNEGYELDVIKVNGEEITGTTFVMPDRDAMVRVVFKKIQHKITLVKTGNGYVSISKQTAGIGDFVNVSAAADDWYILDCIKLDGEVLSDTVFEMPNKDVTVEVVFIPADYKITVEDAQNGFVMANLDYANEGDTVYLSVHAYTGYELESLMVNGKEISGESFVMPASDVTVTATFRKTEYTITLKTSGTGKASLSKTTANYRDQIEVTVTTDDMHYAVITVNGSEITGTTFKMPNKDTTVTVTFEGKPCKVNLVYDKTMAFCELTLGPGETSTESLMVPYGTLLGICVNPKDGYVVLDQRVDGVSQRYQIDHNQNSFSFDVYVNKPEITVEFEFKLKSEAKNGWIKKGDDYYYISAYTYHKGWLLLGNKTYYMDYNTCKMVTGWKKIDGTWFYFKNSGEMYTGWLNQSGKWYYLDEMGFMATGWQIVSGKWYYFESDGTMCTGWLDLGGSWYYLDESGAMATGWKEISGKWYYFDLKYGSMKTGWVKDGGSWYFLKDNGSMATGWIKDGSSWYYLSKAGVMQKGWLKLGNSWYYLDGTGVMQTGWVQISGKWYYFYSSGAMASNTTVDGCKLGEDGAWIK